MRLRSLSLATVALTSGALLAGCSSAPVDATHAGCTPVFEAGDASNTVDVDAATPFEAPIAVTDSQLTIFGGEGDPAEEGDVVVTQYSIFDGTTGDMLETSDPDRATEAGLQPTQRVIQAVGGETALSQALQCTQTGSGAAFVGTYGSLFGEGIAQNGIDPESTAVVVFDVAEAFSGRADGWPQPATSTMPSVSLAPNGQPGVTWAGVAAPTASSSFVSIKGDGVVVAEEDTVVVQYSLFEWGGDTVRQSTWDTQPAELPITGTIPAFQDALIGQPVGSQILIAVPSAEGYNDGDLFFVVDVLAVVAA